MNKSYFNNCIDGRIVRFESYNHIETSCKTVRYCDD